tara:strand:- start:126 stop:356 length:231 start_codon:yes stop_codon:yes gene_type:complete
MVDNTTHIIYAHLFIIGALGLHYYKNMGKKKIQTMGTYIYEEEGDMKQNVLYQEFKREINNIKDRLNSIEEEQYIM